MSVPEDEIMEGEQISEGESVASEVGQIQTESSEAQTFENISPAEHVLPEALFPKNTIYVVLLFLTLLAFTLIIWICNKEASDRYDGGFLPF